MQISTLYNGDKLKSMLNPENLLLLARNRKPGMQWGQAHQNWTVEDWKTVAWFNES